MYTDKEIFKEYLRQVTPVDKVEVPRSYLRSVCSKEQLDRLEKERCKRERE